eukprot:CAMPEP_0194481736 /NCGR_PEP_ID=MMETSP0253-20130528/4019_1 /TAXON_ID=2966 /ORGANISM="Noctiluca scintillans" /LENGTH=67 /DNA_ID=CAMNT_0039321237 /DNA_START=108 /DNA_END=311 /DNA_ORIENTATION=-
MEVLAVAPRSALKGCAMEGVTSSIPPTTNFVPRWLGPAPLSDGCVAVPGDRDECGIPVARYDTLEEQ